MGGGFRGSHTAGQPLLAPFFLPHYLPGVSPESIPHAPPLGSGVRVRSRTGGLVQQCSRMPLKKHDVLYLPYFQDLGFFLLNGS